MSVTKNILLYKLMFESSDQFLHLYSINRLVCLGMPQMYICARSRVLNSCWEIKRGSDTSALICTGDPMHGKKRNEPVVSSLKELSLHKVRLCS